MGDFSFLAVPNIEGMRMWWYIQIFGIVILFGICLFFLLFFLLKYRRSQVLFHKANIIDHQAQDFEKQLLIQNIQKSFGKDKLVLFIEYLERFVTLDTYANLSQLLHTQWFAVHHIQEFEQVIYTHLPPSKELECIIDAYFTL